MSTQTASQQQVIESLPQHLRPFVAVQNYDAYTPRDHAVWRFLLHQLKARLKRSAQATYLEGLQRTGIDAEAIPRIEHINTCLNKLGWRAVVVDGFLPPAVFMEFQALKVLAIAVNMRSFEHMLYTPAPDIVHEAAGHAPFLIDIDYAEFLQRFGELGMRAIPNQDDIELYEAVRELSILKESTQARAEQIAQAEQRLEDAQSNSSEPSEAALLARLHWWTVEYGLVGSPTDYRIFGAGLLSSLGESETCLDDATVIKQVLTVNAINKKYDITTTQPHLFVTRSCRHLSQILAEFGRKMACNLSGKEALDIALKAGTVCTATLNSGVQIAGKISQVHTDAVGNAIYLNTTGKTQLAYQSSELPQQGTAQHPQGFGSPIGRLAGFERCLSSYTVDELKRHQVEIGHPVELHYLSGIKVQGLLTDILRREQKNLIFVLQNCTVTDEQGQILFDPEWGRYDMAIGDSVVSVSGGSADKTTYPLYSAPSHTTTEVADYDEDTQQQFKLYQAIRDARTSKSDSNALIEQVLQHPNPDWLLLHEALELAGSDTHTLASKLENRLQSLTGTVDSATDTLITYAINRSYEII